MITGSGIPKIQSSKPLPMVRPPALGLRPEQRDKHQGRAVEPSQRNCALREEHLLIAPSHLKRERWMISSGKNSRNRVTSGRLGPSIGRKRASKNIRSRAAVVAIKAALFKAALFANSPAPQFRGRNGVHQALKTGTNTGWPAIIRGIENCEGDQWQRTSPRRKRKR